MWVFRIFIFLKNKNKNVNKKKKIFFIFLGLTMIDLAPTYFHSQWKIRDHVVLKINIFVGLIFLILKFSYVDKKNLVLEVCHENSLCK